MIAKLKLPDSRPHKPFDTGYANGWNDAIDAMLADAEAVAILAIPLTAPERLFNGNQAEVDKQNKRLISKWHPDRNKSTSAGAVVMHVGVLYRAACLRIKQGSWGKPVPTRTIRMHGGKTVQIPL
jgi:hypothetical protein